MSEWISVEERLPETGVYKIRVYQNLHFTLAGICSKTQMYETHTAFMRKGKFKVLSGEGNHADFITHWIPLPELPEV